LSNFIEDWLAERKRLKDWRKHRALQKRECAAGRHDLLPEKEILYWAKSNICQRSGCEYREENPTYDPVKAEWQRRVYRAKKKATQAAGALVCAVQGHDMEYLPPPDWMGWCKRCGANG
jgi:hypothetical protein